MPDIIARGPSRPFRILVGTLAGICVLGLAGWTASCAAGQGGAAGRPPDASSPAPAARRAPFTGLPGAALYVEPDSPAVRQVDAWRLDGRDAEAAAVQRIAAAPTAVWITDQAGVAKAAATVAAAARAGQVPVLVAYHVPERDCGGQSGGGASGPAAYRTWVRDLAAAIGGEPAVVVLEPDAVPQAVGGCIEDPSVRYRLLAEAIGTLKAKPSVRVYLDAGNPSWITDTGRLADALRRAGIDRADGFALNVANFETTADNLAYGRRLAKALGGKRFVVDTSRNGNGPHAKGAGDTHWCNPPGRALGEPPSTRTGVSGVDAYLWVKRPGESDGACTDEAPAAGAWWPAYALGLATNRDR
jgi:endoglucanase